MYVETADGAQLGAELARVTLRTTLEPSPANCELWAKLSKDSAPQLTEGKTLRVGRDQLPMRIIAAENAEASWSDASQPVLRKITALYAPTAPITFRSARAVIRENITLSQAYQACGASAVIGRDFQVSRFYVMQGGIPSLLIAALMQEEGGAVVLASGGRRIEFMRLTDLFAQTPLELPPTAAEDTQRSGFLERHEIPTFVSTDANGAALLGDYTKPRATRYSPQKTQRQLLAMSRCLVNAKSLVTAFSPDVQAGALFQIGKRRFVVMTAAHDFVNVGGQGMPLSRFWLGVLA